MKYSQITTSMAKDIAFKLGAVLNDEEAEIFADGYNAALLKVNKNASTELPNYANLSTSSQAAPDDSGLLPCPFCGSPAEHYPDGDMEGYIIMCGNKNGDCNLQAFGFTTPEEAEKAWNTRAALLQGAEPVSQTYELPELIEGMEVSIDVSTCDADAGNRYFGTVTEVSELDIAKNGYILLVQDAEPNFDVNGNSPVSPGGWISCSERMPEMGELNWRTSFPLLITCEIGVIPAYYGFVSVNGDKHYGFMESFKYGDDSGNHPQTNEYGLISNVTHWMPLPEQPQEVK
ncbi:hypothetical protein DMM57_23595 [Salmonella enterica subsp. enterica serovar Typhimurium]|nr:DUF551 domain-containing protein [Salmonella enterica subsp. enterica serovar Typhimurium]ECE9131919.1 DUF551 domain-containing protein [Salmonella enterica subsp. enterica serovar Napoli]EDR3391938.1 DUF551 domain-containing protein [Salmonella enterica subsp. enterica serovar Zaiman]EDR6622432.1 DUF551 domain-containing protein [Salmonella enterica subsp. enterica]EBU9186563.1 hypothetical protein [Salmonella enterica subsp. enterica serovar Typhimurium]